MGTSTALAAIAARKFRKGGRHPLTRKAVAESQRSRMLEAIAHVVADKGYAAASVADVIAIAGVSRRTFYEQFADIEGCFLAAYEAGRERLLRRIRDSIARLPRSDWRARARVSLSAYLDGLAAEPSASWAYSIEVFAAGRKALAERAKVLQHWVDQWRELLRIARRDGARVKTVSDARLLALVGGIEELVRDCLRTRGASKLPDLLDTATELAIAAAEG
ncbi:MAG TPA: helix-turn-helix domain-containing protein [Nevskiaceae bacterium]|nr:helix-turn-helix domain-containing protein [Nevskiaceae bacterium]